MRHLLEIHRSGEGTVYRIGEISWKQFNRSIKPADAARRCRLSRSHVDFAPRWYLPSFHAAIGLWQFGPWADHATVQRLAWRHPWASDWKYENVIITAAGPRIIDFGIVPGAEVPPPGS
jgi:hypothetical protein